LPDTPGQPVGVWARYVMRWDASGTQVLRNNELIVDDPQVQYDFTNSRVGVQGGRTDKLVGPILFINRKLNDEEVRFLTDYFIQYGG